MAASPKDKFDAAVKVIKNLPKNGSFQPSHELMLLFYGYFKQATEGPCTLSKPSFWEVIKKAKWEAWNKLGEMSPEDAMLSYVEELKKVARQFTETMSSDKKIVETMPQTNIVAEFMMTIGTFYELVEEKLPYMDDMLANHMPNRSGLGIDQHHDEADISRVCDIALMKTADLSLQLAEVESQLRGSSNLDPDRDHLDLDVDDNNLDQDRDNLHLGVNDNKLDPDRDIAEEEPESDMDSSIEEDHDMESMEKDIEIKINGEVVGPSKQSCSLEPPAESDGEADEFCDSSDQLVSSGTHLKPSNLLSLDINISSTPQQSPFIAVSCNHVTSEVTDEQQADEQQVFTQAEVHELGGVSPIPPSLNYRPYGPSLLAYTNLRLGQHQEPLSDSLLVNTPGGRDSLNDSLNIDQLLAKYEGDAQSGAYHKNGSLSSEHDQFHIESLPSHSKVLCSRGGGESPNPDTPGERSASRRRDGSWSRGQPIPDHSGSSRRGLFTQRGAGGGGGSEENWQHPLRTDMMEQISMALMRLQQDMNNVITRLDSLERLSRLYRQEDEDMLDRRRRRSFWWPFPNLSGKMVFVVMVWPFLVHWILIMLHRRKKGFQR